MNASFKKRLLGREKLVGILLTLPSPELVEIAADAGFDWLFLDMEHGLLDIGAVQRMVQAAGDSCPCIVRVPVNEPVWIKKALDVGPAGLIFPNIRSPKEAAEAIRQASYPPQGVRSVGISRAHRYGARFAEYIESANRDTALIIQAEHIDATRTIEGILDTKGVDAVFIGPYDLSASLGKPGRIGDGDVIREIDRVRKACAERGLPAGIFAGNIEAARKALEDGFSFICAGMDVTLFSHIAGRTVEELKRAK